MRKFLVYLLMTITWTAGNLTPVVLFWLIWPRAGPAKAVVFDTSDALLFNFFVALIFPLQHSVWTQTRVKRLIRRALGDYFERPMYGITSGVALVAMALLWRSTNLAIWTPSEPILWVLRGLLIGSIAFQAYCTTMLDEKLLSGMAQLKALALRKPVRVMEFRERGPYRKVRHPIAAAQVAMLWIACTLFADLLLLAVVWTVWIVLAARLEERRLSSEFGSTYRDYRKRTGFFWPRLSGGGSAPSTPQ